MPHGNPASDDMVARSMAGIQRSPRVPSPPVPEELGLTPVSFLERSKSLQYVPFTHDMARASLETRVPTETQTCRFKRIEADDFLSLASSPT